MCDNLAQMRGSLTFLMLVALCASAATFEDPAPPRVLSPAPSGAVVARRHPRVTYHQAPKPLSSAAKIHEWKEFLGPNHNLTSTETHLLKEFAAAGPALVWEMETGAGYSAPAIQGDRLVYIHRMGNQEIVEALDPDTGDLYWTFAYPTDFSDRYGYSNGPRASPVIDEDRVYVYGAQAKLHCLRLRDGALLWKRDIQEEFKIPQDFFGVAPTPLVENGLLIVTIGAPGGPTVAAFDKLTGRLKWGAGEEWGAGYASPIPANVHGKRVIFVFAGGESQPPTGGLMLINPADGKVHSTFPWRSRTYESVNAASPVIAGNQVLISATYRTGAAMLDINPDLTLKQTWTSADFDLHWTTAIADSGYLYAFAGRNEPDASLVAINIKTGQIAWDEVLEWQETLSVNGTERDLYLSPYRASMLKVDGRYLVLGEQGQLLWLALSPQGPKILSQTTLFLSRQSWTPPVISKGLLYITQNERDFISGKPPRLLCYDLRADD
jgi:outer membrane protein assembly factor BamB